MNIIDIKRDLLVFLQLSNIPFVVGNDKLEGEPWDGSDNCVALSSITCDDKVIAIHKMEVIDASSAIDFFDLLLKNIFYLLSTSYHHKIKIYKDNITKCRWFSAKEKRNNKLFIGIDKDKKIYLCINKQL